MAEGFITHAFISAKADSPDTSLVSSSEWNDNHVIGGGVNSQILTRDTSTVHGASWINAPLIQTASGTYSGGNLSAALAPITVVTNSNAILLIIVSGSATLATGTTATLSLYRDGTQTRIYTFTSDGQVRPVIAELFSEAAGSHTWSIILSTSGANYTASNVTLQIMTIGRL